MTADTRIDPPLAGSEKDVLLGFLNYLRETIMYKADGLSDELLRQPHHPSGLTMLGIVKHLAYVERYWFRVVFRGEDVPMIWSTDDPDADWRIEADDTTSAIIALYRDEIDRANKIVAGHEPDDPAAAPGPRHGGLQLRWILVHMVEETARHAGHADLIREALDGQTGE